MPFNHECDGALCRHCRENALAEAGGQRYTVFIRHCNETTRHDLVSVRVLSEWFPEIYPKFWTNFDVNHISLSFTSPEGEISQWVIYNDRRETNEKDSG